MFKQVYDYNGNPYILKVDKNNNILESEIKKYSLYKFTEIPPPSRLYPPRTFDGSEWHGASAEEYEEHNKPPIILPDDIQKTIANLQIQLVKSQSEIKHLKKRFEDLKSDKEEGVE